jgi:hypothetical protein
LNARSFDRDATQSAEDRSWIFLGLRWSDWQARAQPIGKRDRIIGRTITSPP